ncbi:alkaline phosphatase family protein [Temperatibacter marinus]|uniref:Alkaline phosphatase family protein n=1 Tax=Temperatibacter marinus TaxID=1456591 RepID=A0AA52EBK2_9PROT|nr:alkaline phosphatase family protein [Temperatibacter marinus]WND01801.1 alkaline phosphatase family protein [Temperatibacter marinus]
MKQITTVAAMALIMAGSAPASEQVNQQEDPKRDGKLIIQITLDQFRSDYLVRYKQALTKGFRTITEKGVGKVQGYVDHAITNSHPGHASLATGAYPRTHGYSANEWWDYVDGKWRWVDGAIDHKTTIIGNDKRPGYSPFSMRVRSLSDWVLKADKKAKSIALSSNETVVSYAGKTGRDAFWYDREEGRFITSSYFRQDYPKWVEKFNAESLEDYKAEEWALSLPDNLQGLADKDDQSYEDFGNHYVFPHRFADEYNPEHETRSRQTQLDYWFYEIPMVDLAVLDLAKKAIKAEKLGQRNSVDYLALSLGSLDNIGHIYGGYSLETLEALYLFDHALAGFIQFLDASIGRDHYILSLSGDHGAPDPIERTIAKGGEAYRIPQEEIENLLDHIDEIGAAHEGSQSALVSKIESALEKEPYIADAVTEAEVYGLKPSSNPYMDLYRKSWVRGRVADFPLWTTKPHRDHHPARYGIYVQYKPNTHFGYGMVVHGSPYDYDRLVPIFFFGGGVVDQKLREARTIDVAPTLAKWMALPYPETVDGKPLFKKESN